MRGVLIPLSVVLGEAWASGSKRKRQGAYSGERKATFAGGFLDLVKDAVPKPKRKKPKEKTGRLIKRTPFASRQRWRVW